MNPSQSIQAPSINKSRILMAVVMTAAAVIAGWGAVSRPGITIVVLAGLIFGCLLLLGKFLLLITLTSVVLSLGSSSLVSPDSLVSAGKFLMLAGVGACGLVLLLKGGRATASRGFLALCFGFVALAIVSTIYSVDPTVSLQHSAGLVLLFLSSIVAVPALVNKDSRHFLALVASLAMVGTILVLSGLILDRLGIVPGFQVGRFQGLLDNPNTLGFFLAPLLPAVIILGFGKSEKRRLFIALGIVLFLSLLLSGSRGGLLSAVFGSVVGFAIARNAKKALVWILAASIAAATLITFIDVRIRPEGEGLFEAGTGSNRLTAWSDGLRLISSRPLLGHGFGVTLAYFPEARTESLYRGSSKFHRLHSSFLEAALELGWFGATYLFLLATSGIWRGWTLARTDPGLKWKAAALAGGLAGGVMEGVFEAGLLAPGGLLAFHFWMFAGLIHSLGHQVKSGSSS